MHIDKNKNEGFALVELVIVDCAESTDLENEVGAGVRRFRSLSVQRLESIMSLSQQRLIERVVGHHMWLFQAT